MKDLPPFEERSVAFPPTVIGEPHGTICERCGEEEAEYRVRTWGCQAMGMQGMEGSGAECEDLCGTCLLREEREARKTLDESCREALGDMK